MTKELINQNTKTRDVTAAFLSTLRKTDFVVVAINWCKDRFLFNITGAKANQNVKSISDVFVNIEVGSAEFIFVEPVNKHDFNQPH